MKRFLYVIFLFAIGLVLSACGGGSSGGGGGGGGSNTSHNAGLNCLDSACHAAGGGAPRTFSVAGTIYKNGGGGQENATVSLYEAGTNNLLETIPTDDSGNFYTSTNLDTYFTGAGVSPQVDGPAGNAGSMVSAPGACNASGCHAAGNRIVAN